LVKLIPLLNAGYNSSYRYRLIGILFSLKTFVKISAQK